MKLDFSELKEYLDNMPTIGGGPGSDTILLLNGECLFRHQVGFENLEKQEPMTGKERVNIYSCSKVITCVAAMQLFEKKLFRLEDALSDYIPEYAKMSVIDGETIRPAKSPILIENLFTMSAGFSYDVNSPGIRWVKQHLPDCSNIDIAKGLAQDPLHFDPGTRWQYSLCHDILATVVEVISGQPFAEYVKEHILSPLGMTETTFMLPDSDLDTIATQYSYDKTLKKPCDCGKAIYAYKFGPKYASGGAGGISTCEDYAKFLEALRVGDIILGKDTVDFMATDRLTPPLRDTYGVAQGYGYGLGIRCKSSVLDNDITDFGWGGAAGAAAFVDKVHGFTLFTLQHMLHSPNPACRAQLPIIVRKILRKQ